MIFETRRWGDFRPNLNHKNATSDRGSEVAQVVQLSTTDLKDPGSNPLIVKQSEEKKKAFAFQPLLLKATLIKINLPQFSKLCCIRSSQ